jgi:hypothetical protein
VPPHGRRSDQPRSGCDVEDAACAQAIERSDELVAPPRVLAEAEERANEVVAPRQPGEQLERVFLAF